MFQGPFFHFSQTKSHAVSSSVGLFLDRIFLAFKLQTNFSHPFSPSSHQSGGVSQAVELLLPCMAVPGSERSGRTSFSARATSSTGRAWKSCSAQMARWGGMKEMLG